MSSYQGMVRKASTHRYHAESIALFLASICVCIRWQTVFKRLTKSVII